MPNKVLQYIKEKGYGRSTELDVFKEELADVVNHINPWSLEDSVQADETIDMSANVSIELFCACRSNQPSVEQLMVSAVNRIVDNIGKSADSLVHLSISDNENLKVPFIVLKLERVRSYETFIDKIVDTLNKKFRTTHPEALGLPIEKEFRTGFLKSDYEKCQTEQDLIILRARLLSSVYQNFITENLSGITIEGKVDIKSEERIPFIVKYNPQV